MTWIFVALGGASGAFIRFLVGMQWNRPRPLFPLGTWIANVSGAILLAILVILHQRDLISQGIWMFSGVGFCGAYTTFSTFGNEAFTLLQEGEIRKAIWYVLSTLIISFTIVAIIISNFYIQ